MNTFNSHVTNDVLVIKHLPFTRFSIDGWFVVNASKDGSGRGISLGSIRDEGEDVSSLNRRKNLEKVSVKERFTRIDTYNGVQDSIETSSGVFAIDDP